MAKTHYKRVAQLRSPEDFRAYLEKIGADLDFDEEVESGPDAPLAQPLDYRGKTLSNRFAVLPMEGWDAEKDGRPSDLVKRRWQHFGQSGAKMIWGCEAVAVRHDGRANPLQLTFKPEYLDAFIALRELLVSAHEERFGGSDDLLIGLQLTHSGRFCRPNHKKQMEPHILYHHPLLDRKFHLADDKPLMTDGEIDQLIEDFVAATGLVRQAGFDFVDVKHCHGYLGHEFLTAMDREGKYGGSFENRTRFLREIVAGIRADVPGLDIGVRLSAFDFMPFRPGEDGTGEPDTYSPNGYPYAFGGDSSGTGIDLDEPRQFLNLLQALDIQLVCVTGGSPYYTPHIQRPALFPPSDGYTPQEDPLLGVARQIQVTAELKKSHPDLIMIGSGYSYLQEWLPNVAQNVIRTGRADFVGLGRMILSYPEMAADVLAGNPLQRKRICRTFSDCTTAPRNNIVSGCYPLDDFYKNRPEYDELQAAKKAD